MATKDTNVDPPGSGAEPQGGTAPEQSQPSLKERASGLWRQKPGVRESRSGANDRALLSKEVVNGLDRTEVLVGTLLMVIDFAITVIVFFYWRHSGDAKAKHYAPDFLVAGLIGVGIMAFGAALKRRALLGFAAFIVGLEMISFGLIYGILYLFFGGWLIVRVMRKQRQDQARGKYTGTIDTGKKNSRISTPRPPSASKRYTPPRRVKTASKKQ